MIRSLETLSAEMRAVRLDGMRADAAARLARVAVKRARRKNQPGKDGRRVTFPHGGAAE